jgi:hypothetical protein
MSLLLAVQNDHSAPVHGILDLENPSFFNQILFTIWWGFLQA